MSKEKIDGLIAMKSALRGEGNLQAINKQHNAGKYTARERLAMLFDEGSFVETGLFVKHRCHVFGMEKKDLAGDGVVTGYGRINGRLTYAYAQDFTVSGGSLGEMHANKIVEIQDAALKVGAPIICINDSGGARIQEGVDALGGYGRIFFNNTKASGVIPQISVILGPCAGGAVYSPAITDFIFMVDGISQMFITGPMVIKAVTGEEVSPEQLGGARTHSAVSGVAHYRAANEKECIEKIKRLLSYLPQNNMEFPQKYPVKDRFERDEEALNEVIPENSNKAYDMKKIIRLLADREDFMEYQEEYARNIITGFSRIGGRSVGIIASQPNFMAGCLDINASDKAARFIRCCDAFNIPILTLVDVPGFLPGTAQEYGGIIRHGAKMLYAYSEAVVPKITLILRKSYGGAYIGMCSKHLGADAVYAWPGAEIAVMGAEGAANIIFAKSIHASQDPAAERAARIKEYEDQMMNPYIAANRGYVDDVIVPSKSREYIIRSLECLETKRVAAVPKKHGNIPL